jgi:predicted nucleotide-binding protein (sugar kinase/HSP70/actin superfamily)
MEGERSIKKAARPYLPELVGGHGQNSIGETVLYAKKGFDGVVQLAPFTCIPEIVAKSIIPEVSKGLNIPVLTLMLDEQTGKAGTATRLEAFVDLLRMRRSKLAMTRGETA